RIYFGGASASNATLTRHVVTIKLPAALDAPVGTPRATITSGDVNADGFRDIIVGISANGAETVPEYAQKTYVILGRPDAFSIVGGNEFANAATFTTDAGTLYFRIDSSVPKAVPYDNASAKTLDQVVALLNTALAKPTVNL